MISLIFAHEREARVTIQRLKAKRVDDYTYRFDEGLVVVTGLGLLNAAIHSASAIESADEVWNLGICGALNPSLPLYELYEVGHTGRYIHAVEPLEKRGRQLLQAMVPRVSIGQGSRLVSLDFPLHSVSIRDNLAAEFDLVDMEGYALATLAQAKKKPIRMWKLVSDYAASGTSDLISCHLDDLSTKLADAVEMHLAAHL